MPTPVPSYQDVYQATGEAAAYAGLRGFTDPTLAAPWLTYAAAQHPVFPVTINAVEVSGAWQIQLGGANQRCLLPQSTGTHSLPCTLAGETSYTPMANGHQVPRYDLIYGQSSYNATTGATSATFQYVMGAGGSKPNAPPDLNGWAAVASVTVAPGPTFLPTAVQILLSSVIGGGHATGPLASDGPPQSIAANVVGPPYFTPYIAGNLQQTTPPTENAMPYIQEALTAVGPGGAIYIPSGIYGVGSSASTTAQRVYSGSGDQWVGQTIIFGGDVKFVALGDYTAFEFGDAVTTVGTAKFYDTGMQTGTLVDSLPLTGAGSEYSDIALSGATETIAAGTSIIIFDADGNSLVGTVTVGGLTSISVESTGELNEGTFVTPPAYGTISAGASVSIFLTSTKAAVTVTSANSVNIDSLFTTGWANGVVFDGLTDSEIRAVACLNVRGTGIQVTNISGAVHDNHFGSIYCDTGGGGAVCGLDINGLTGTGPGDTNLTLNSLKIDHVECLGFSGAAGPSIAEPPHSDGGIAATGACIRGSQSQGISMSIVFISGCANGLVVDAGVLDIAVSLLTAGSSGPSSGSYGGYSVACCGQSDMKVSNISIGYCQAGNINVVISGSNNSVNGIYMRHTQACHIDSAGVGNRAHDGVYFDVGCTSIGIDELVLVNNGTSPSGTYYGVNASDAGGSGPSYISIDKLDASRETAPGGTINVTPFTHLSYNDLGSRSTSTAYAFGYYTSNGNSQAAPGFTVGEQGQNTPYGYQIANSSTAGVGLTAVGSDATVNVRGIAGTVLLVSNLKSGGAPFHALALDDAGNLAIPGAFYGPMGISITAGSGLPSGSAVVGSIYANVTGVAGGILYVFTPGGWVSFA